MVVGTTSGLIITAIADTGVEPSRYQQSRALLCAAFSFILRLSKDYLISNPLALRAADTFSIAVFASASVNVFSNDWNIKRNASDVRPSLVKVSKREIFWHS